METKYVFSVAKLVDVIAENEKEAQDLADIWGLDEGRQVEFPNHDYIGNFVGDALLDGELRRVYKDWCIEQ